ncbi:MAG TPA: hypothetical protein VFU59_00915 [Candidatus Eisenbacteria bacterium]|nr:hypothetical protein [Candidatus Eisenbacteria bacterium]
MGRRGNQTFLKNQKAQKRVARANAKRAEKQAKRDDKVARAAAGELPYGAPIEGMEHGDLPGNGAAPVDGEEPIEGIDDSDADDADGDDADEDAPISATEH